MNATYLGSAPAFTTFENATSTTYHFFLRENSVYRVEANCQEQFDNLTPIRIEKIEPKEVNLTGALKARLEGEFLE
jgi:hypothetical protein